MDEGLHQLAGYSQGYRGKVLVLIPGSHIPCRCDRPPVVGYTDTTKGNERELLREAFGASG